MKNLLSAIIVLSIVYMLSPPAFAANADWKGLTSDKWNVDANWVGGVKPNGTENAQINYDIGGGPTTIDLDPLSVGTVTVGSINFENTLHFLVPYKIGTTALGQTLILGNNGFINVAGGTGNVVNTQTIQGSVVLAGNGRFSNYSGNGGGGLLIITGDVTGGATGALTLEGTNTDNNRISGNIADGTAPLAVTKDEAGMWILSGNNTYTGTTRISAGTLVLENGSAIKDTGAVSLDNVAGVALKLNNANETIGSLSGGGALGGNVNLTNFTLTTGGDDTSTTYAGVISGAGGALTKIGNGTLTLTGINTYAGLTTVTAGELDLNTAGTAIAGSLTVNGGTAKLLAASQIAATKNLVVSSGTFDIQTFNQTLAGVQMTGGNITGSTGVLTSTGAYDMQSGTASAILGGAVALNKTTAGTVTLSGANTYTGATAINAGTLVASNASALGNGSAVAVENGATLDVGTTNVTVNALYNQKGGSTLKVTVASPSSSGKITSNVNATVDAASNVNVTVPSSIYVPANSTFTIIHSAAGAGVNVPGTITSSDPRLTFSAISSGADLILTAIRSGTGFSSLGTNSNTSAVGAVLDNISNPSGDMATVLNTLEGLSNSQTESALATVVPVVDGGVTNVSNTVINQFVGTTTDRLGSLFAQAHNEETGQTGVSTGSKEKSGFEAWGRGFGEAAHQDPRGLSNGYSATIWGTALGCDIPAFNNKVRLGVDGGYAFSDVNSKDNSGATDINSYQSTFYGGYIDGSKPYYINGAFSFAYNTYKGKRNIAVGAITRTANSSYRGQQYSVLFDGGYTFKTKQVNITPIVSLQYLHLHLQSYTETGADALNLNVASQDYDLLETGLGAKFDRPFEVSFGTLTPEVHAKWLYDAIADKQATTSTFSGGGGSFATNGFTPARNALDVGGRLALVTKGNWSFDANYDFEYKQDYTSHTGWADIRYSF